VSNYLRRTPESSFTALATNMLYNLFSDTLILTKNLHLRFVTTDSAGKQLKYLDMYLHRLGIWYQKLSSLHYCQLPS